ncbi:hypothetical protein QQF64_031440 [Cirrhinus molitorella]|uniref:Uncharacterized protein n=1 Tax=Cirrhinus molitorella TaxID=172907 RepID=A0ABR3MX34_9TELE
MKGWLCTLLLLETFVFVVTEQDSGGHGEKEISQQISNENRRQNPPQTDSLRDEASTYRQQYCHLSFSDIHTALRELTATVTEQKANIRALETRLKEQETVFLEELNKKTNEISALTQSQVDLRKENRELSPMRNMSTPEDVMTLRREKERFMNPQKQQAHNRMKHMAEHHEDGHIHPQYSHHSHHGQQRELISPPPEQDDEDGIWA